jgi:hypothetical protein
MPWLLLDISSLLTGMSYLFALEGMCGGCNQQRGEHCNDNEEIHLVILLVMSDLRSQWRKSSGTCRLAQYNDTLFSVKDKAMRIALHKAGF